MLIVILADDEQKTELLSKSTNEKVTIEYINDYRELSKFKDADAVFILLYELNIRQLKLITQPLFIHSVLSTLADLPMPFTVSGINAWPTFLQRNLWEVATKDEGIVKRIFEALGWKYLLVPDEPGLIAARIIAMIINEAYFTYGENISTKEDIDIAMKLGTNYPFGPFEWAQKIGLGNIYDLLKILCRNSRRYDVALALENELMVR